MKDNLVQVEGHAVGRIISMRKQRGTYMAGARENKLFSNRR